MATGILALQGAFAEHAAMLDRLGEPHFEIRQARDLEKPLDRLIIPGGESTVMRRLLHDLDLFDALRARITEGMPVFGTCAGLILLAKQVDGGVPCFATMDIAVKRNAYGRQLGSFFTNDSFEGLGTLPMTFIRAPYIEQVSPKVEVLSETAGHITAVRYGHQLALAFHPEVGHDTRLHEAFLRMI